MSNPEGGVWWRFPPLAVEQVDNWGDAQVVGLASVDTVRGEAKTWNAGVLNADAAGVSFQAGVNSRAEVIPAEGGRGAEGLIAKLPGGPGGGGIRIQRGSRLSLEMAVDRGHWFDSASGTRLKGLGEE